MKSWLGRFLIGLAVLSTASAAHATTWHVENNGTDSSTCGATVDPCRTIGQAITNAAAGDTVVVGPGLYGNLGYDFTEVGEEPPCSDAGSILCVDKRLTIESSNGAERTRLNAGSLRSGVRLSADGSIFGRVGRGFTLYGEQGNFISVGLVSGVEVSGNVVVGSLYIDGSSNTATHNQVISTHSIGGVGVMVTGNGHSLTHNAVTGVPESSGIAFDIYGTGHSITQNVAVGFEAGIAINSSTSGVVIQSNAILSNRYGVALSAGGSATIHGNNIFGNGLLAGNCGVLNDSGSTIDATNNYWGSASGPGPEPADQVCDVTGSTNVSPSATVAFPIASTGGGGGNGAPVCTAAQPVPTVLWPANGQFTRTWIIGVGDPDDDPVSISITSVTQDEPVRLNSGDTGPDAVVFGSSVGIRAQRNAQGNGRVYRVQFSASDGNGGSCTGAVTVGVPNSQKPGQAIVDDGQAYISTQP